MIRREELTGEWIRVVSKAHKADPLLIVKVICAFLLLEGLVKQRLLLSVGTELLNALRKKIPEGGGGSLSRNIQMCVAVKGWLFCHCFFKNPLLKVVRFS